MDQASPASRGGTRVLTAFGETPEQIRAELHKALEQFGASALESSGTGTPEPRPEWLTHPAPDRWSPAQVAEHVLLVNERVGRMVTLLCDGRPLPDLPMVPGVMVGGRRRCPPEIEPGAGVPWAELAGRWHVSCELLTSPQLDLEGADLSRRLFHPFLGPIDAHDWLRMATFHTRHHRRQLFEGQTSGGEA